MSKAMISLCSLPAESTIHTPAQQSHYGRAERRDNADSSYSLHNNANAMADAMLSHFRVIFRWYSRYFDSEP